MKLHTPPSTAYAQTVSASLELTTAAAHIEQAATAYDRLACVDAAIAALERARAILTTPVTAH